MVLGSSGSETLKASVHNDWITNMALISIFKIEVVPEAALLIRYISCLSWSTTWAESLLMYSGNQFSLMIYN